MKSILYNAAKKHFEVYTLRYRPPSATSSSVDPDTGGAIYDLSDEIEIECLVKAESKIEHQTGSDYDAWKMAIELLNPTRLPTTQNEGVFLGLEWNGRQGTFELESRIIPDLKAVVFGEALKGTWREDV